MRIVLVHGINNQGRCEQAIIDEWFDALASSLSRSDLALMRKVEICAPYYGDVLYDATRAGAAVHDAPVAQSAAGGADDQARFYMEALEELAPAAGVTESQVRAEQDDAGPVAQGMPQDRRLNAILRALEHVSPLKGRLIMRLLPQAFFYLSRPIAAQAVDALVAPALAQPCIVVAHSLGTIVTYKLLRQQTCPVVPLYLTLGSPLAIRAVQNAIGPAFERPGAVERWLNGFDRNDTVSLGRALEQTTFGAGVENLGDIDNGAQDAHDIRMYLRDRRIAATLVQAVKDSMV